MGSPLGPLMANAFMSSIEENLARENKLPSFFRDSCMQLCDLGRKINHPLPPIFTSKKFIDYLRETELKPTLVNQQNVAYEFKCDLCDANYIGYTCRHLSISV